MKFNVIQEFQRI